MAEQVAVTLLFAGFVVGHIILFWYYILRREKR